MATGRIQKIIKSVEITTTCTASTWQTLQLPDGVASERVLSIDIENQSTENGYWILWDGPLGSSQIQYLRLNTSDTSLRIVNVASSSIKLRINYIA